MRHSRVAGDRCRGAIQVYLGMPRPGLATYGESAPVLPGVIGLPAVVTYLLFLLVFEFAHAWGSSVYMLTRTGKHAVWRRCGDPHNRRRSKQRKKAVRREQPRVGPGQRTCSSFSRSPALAFDWYHRDNEDRPQPARDDWATVSRASSAGGRSVSPRWSPPTRGTSPAAFVDVDCGRGAPCTS